MADWRDWELDEIPEWSKKSQLVLLTAVFVVLFIILSYFWLIPLKKNINQAISKEHNLRNQFKLKVQQVAELSNTNKNIELMKNALQQTIKQFPSENELAQLLASINAVGTKNNLFFQRIDWQEGKQFKHFFRLPLKLELKGSYQNFGLFSQALANLPYVVILHEIKINGLQENKTVDEKQVLKNANHSSNERMLHFSILAHTYHYDEKGLK